MTTRPPLVTHLSVAWLCGLALLVQPALLSAAELTVEVQQLTRGPQHHFFGYIGHVRTIPWNSSGRYIVALRTDFQDHMPGPDEAAEIILIDTQRDSVVIP